MNTNEVLYGLRSNGGANGDVFTSREVVHFMLDQVDYMSDKDLRNVSILEPSCGEGEFVVEIAKRLMLSAKRFGFDATDAFARNVRALDIDEKKINFCREQIKQLGIGVADNIDTADFLHTDLGKFDIVVGNPPYIRYENIPAEMRGYCKANFFTFHYRSDLYVPFFEKSLSHLNEGGRHCFICSNRWLKNEYGKKLRLFISANFQLQRLINLEQSDAFQEDVLAYPAITLIANLHPMSTFEYAECDDISRLCALPFSNRPMPAGDDWTEAFFTTSTSQLHTIEEMGFNIGIGVATGADSVFISKVLPEKVEHDLILPGINAKDLRGDKLQWQGEYLLNPYKPNGELVNLDDYPRAKSYLESHRSRLSSRHIAKKSPSRWYKTIDRISISLLKQPKVLLPDMSGNTFVFVDEGQYYPLHNIYYVTGRSSKQLRLLAAFLMSDFVRKQLSSVTNQMNGGFSRWQSQHLRKLRLPDINAISVEDAETIITYYEQRNIEAINRQVADFVNNPSKLTHQRSTIAKELTLQFCE